MSVIGTALRRAARRARLKRRAESVEVMRYWPEMDDAPRPGRIRYLLLCLAVMVLMTIVVMAIGIKLIRVKQELRLQHRGAADAMSLTEGSPGVVLDLSSMPAAVELSTPGRKNTLANSGVLELKAAGFSDDLIVRRIKMSRADYKLAPDDLFELKKAGLSHAVISAMRTAARQR